LPAGDRRFLTGRYQLPQPRVAFGQAMTERGLGRAGMDISDGLAADLGHMCEASGCGASVVLPRVPVSAALAELLAEDPDLLLSAVAGGDDYEVLLAAPAEQLSAVHEAATATGTQVTEIGVFTSSKDVVFTDSDGQSVVLPKAGFTHF
jgi:thiamine-monophosphate kinase